MWGSFFLLAGCGQKTQLDAAGEAFVVAQQALAVGDRERALANLDASIAARPDVWAYVLRARLYAEQGEDVKATEDVEAGLSLDPEQSDLLWLKKQLKKPKHSRFQGRDAAPPSVSK